MGRELGRREQDGKRFQDCRPSLYLAKIVPPTRRMDRLISITVNEGGGVRGL